MELWDIYDANRSKTGKIINRDSDEKLKKGEYHIVSSAIIENSKLKILISKRSRNKNKYPEFWECNGGSVKLGENSLEAIIRELNEELGIVVYQKEGTLVKTVQQENYFRDIWKFEKDIDIQDIDFKDKEATEAKWIDKNQYKKMFMNGEIVPSGNWLLDIM